MKDQLAFDDEPLDPQFSVSWEATVRRIQPEITPAWFERFIKPLRPLHLEDGVAKVSAPGQFVYDWIRNRYLASLQSYLSDELGYSVIVEVLIDRTSHVEAPPIGPVVVERVHIDSVPRFRPNPKFTFSTYVVGDSNKLAVAGAKALVEDSTRSFNPLFIYGQPGLGKTHLLHAIAGELLDRFPKKRIAYITAASYVEEFVNALSNGRMDSFRRRIRQVDVWLLDDIQYIAGKDRTEEELFHTFNSLQTSGVQIVFTSDRAPHQLRLMEERMRSRLQAGLVADIQAPDTELRCAILLSKAKQEGTVLPYEVARYLAETVPGATRALEGALIKLLMEASLADSTISLSLAQQLVERYYQNSMMQKAGIDDIIKVVSDHFRITPEEIRGSSRRAPIVHARHIAIYIARTATGNSWNHIGDQFGDRDHSTIMHAYQKLADMIDRNTDLRSEVRMLIQRAKADGSL